MEQIPNNTVVTTAYPPLTTYQYAYPTNFGDATATNYVHSLTSNPYYYFIPHYTYPSGYHSSHPHYAHVTNSCIRPRDNNFIVRPTILPETNCVNSDVPYGYPRVVAPTQVAPHRNYENDELKENGDCGGNVENSSEELEEVRNDTEKSIDPRVINILEPFRQLYSEREDTLKTIFPGLYSKLSEFFKKVNSLILENNVKMEGEKSSNRALKRSLSLDDASNCKCEMFKVRPIDSDDTLIISNGRRL